MRIFLLFLVLIFSFLEAKSQSDRNADNGAMLIIGSHDRDDIFLKQFADLMGTMDSLIVVIPTGQPQSVLSRDTGFVELKSRFNNFGFKNVSVLHTLDKKVADKDSTVEQLKKAKGVYFTGAGGAQRIIPVYYGTKVQREIMNVYRRGGVIAGSSAGAIIFGEYIRKRKDSDDMFRSYEYVKGLDTSLNFLPGTVFEAHLFEDNRQDILTGVIRDNPSLLGIGIDYQTGIVVKNDILEVVGLHYAAIYDSSYNGHYMVLEKGDRYHLVERRMMKPNEGRVEISLPETELKEYEGSYAGGSGAVFYIKMKGGKLFITENKSNGGADLFVERKDFLFVKIVNLQLVFERNENNEIERMIMEPIGMVCNKRE